ncbi:unnamed protein product [Effrenium voratum]|nr:unnamed protein product [Effrenium voratum]
MLKEQMSAGERHPPALLVLNEHAAAVKDAGDCSRVNDDGARFCEECAEAFCASAPESESPTKSKLLRGADGEESRGQYLERELSQLDVAITLPDMDKTLPDRCYPNHEGTRALGSVALIDTSGTAWLCAGIRGAGFRAGARRAVARYNPVNDDCIQIADFPVTADRILWDSSDSTIFVACDQAGKPNPGPSTNRRHT